MTRDVKTATVIENAARVHYNLRVSTARIYGPCVAIALLAAVACEKKNNKPSDTGAITALDRAGSSGPVDTSPLQSIDVGKLDANRQQLFYKMVGALTSPCGKSESLRKSYTSDTSCKRAAFAVRYVLAFIEDEQGEDFIREQYQGKYEPKAKPAKLDVSKAPRVGNDDAPIKIVEFFDYACPHCRDFKLVLDRVATEHAGKVVEYFLMYPLGKWPDSKSAAQATLAANAQGKFKEMHTLLFANAPRHSKDDVLGYAKELGLDLAKFEKDYAAASSQVELDRAQGESVNVESTPTVYFNDRKYEGPLTPKYIGMWIDEELAVNR